MTADPIAHLLSFPVTRPFGDLSFPQYGRHTGVDLGLPLGTPLYAIGDGIVTVDDDDPTFDAGAPATWSGIQVTYRVADDGTSVTCAHLRVNTVAHGASVTEGQPIGESGNTGASTGPHLHLEMRDISGRLIDPIPYLEAHMFSDQDRTKLDRVLAIAETLLAEAEANEPLVWIARAQRGLNVETGAPFDGQAPPTDPRIRP